MSSDYYFKKWKNVLIRLEEVLNIDLEYQEIESPEKKLCGIVQKLSGMLGGYISVYNEAVECMDQGLQVQKTKYMKNVVLTISRRIVELKHQLSKLEQSNYQFLGRGLADMKLTTLDTEFKVIPEKAIRPKGVQAAIDSVWKLAQELKDKLEEEEKQRKMQELLEQTNVNNINWWDLDEDIEEKNRPSKDEEELDEEELDEESIQKRKMINMIIAQEKTRKVIMTLLHKKQKRAMWEKVLLGLNKPEKRLEVRTRAAVMIQKFARVYFALKRKKMIESQRDAILGLSMCKRPTNEAQVIGEKVTERHISLKRKYEDEWGVLFEKLKRKCFKKRDEILEDYRDEIRSWFYKWYKEAWFFYVIPKDKQGGSILILKEAVPSPHEWKDENEAYIEQMKVNKSKSPEQLKFEKKQAKQEAKILKKEKAQKRKQEEKLLQKMMKNPQMHPGFKYPVSKEIGKIKEAKQNYENDWNHLDQYETSDIKEKFMIEIDKDNAWAEVKLEIRPDVDDEMRTELKKLKEALKMEYERLEQEWPTAIIPQKIPKTHKKKPVKDTISDKIVERMIDLVMKGYLKEYPKTKLEDFKGEPNFAGDDLRCKFIHAMPYGGETRNLWWDRCRELTRGFNKILLVGPKASGKSLLTYAMATLNDAVLFELDLGPAYFGDVSADELNELTKSIISCAKAAQPAVIYIKFIHRLFYTKVRPEEPVLNHQLLTKCLLKKLTKKFHKTDKVTIIASCIDPWLTKSAPLLKLFPTVVMIPNTTYTTTHLILREWVTKNRVIPPDFDISCLARVLQGYGFGFLQQALENFLTAERIVRMAAHGLHPKEVYEYILNHESETPVEYDKYIKWYSEKTHWGILERKHLEAQLEFEELAKKYAEKAKKKKTTSAMSSAASSII